MWWESSSSVRKLHRASLIKAWFDDLERVDGPGMILMSWETSMPVDEWWETILEMVRLAPDKRCLGSIAAGPLEHLLVRHGAEVIDLVESQAQADDRFKQTLRGVWKNVIEDDVWHRINVLLN
jgi:hypothetical protein